MRIGRRPNAKYPWNDEVILILMKLIDDKIFKLIKPVDSKEKAIKLAAQWIPLKEKWSNSKNMNLDARVLQKHFFDPFEKRQSVKLSRDYYQKIYKILTSENIYSNFSDEEINKLAILKEKIFIKTAQTQTDSFDTILKKIHNASSSLSYLANTKWLIFERIGDYPLVGADWGLAVGEINFTMGFKCLEVEMNSIFETSNRTRLGIASADKQLQYLFIDMISSDTYQKRSNIVLRLTEADPNAQTIMLGHFTFHSRKYDNLLTKSIVVQKSEISDSQNLNMGDYDYKNPDYQKIPLEIRKFLYNRQMNRMSLPKDIITNTTSMIQFLKKHKENKVSAKLKSICKDYYIYYTLETNRRLTEDQLTVNYNDEAIKIEAKYTHCISKNQDSDKIWVGNVYHNETKRGVSLELSIEKNINSDLYTEEDDPILLTFWIPANNIDESECFPGVLSGLEDATNGPISYMCLLVDKKVSNFSRLTDERVINFFKILKNPTGIAPESPQLFKLDEYLHK